MLEVAITHRLGDFTLDVGFEAPPGVTVLFGASGSGKSTVINAVAGLLTPDAGRIALDGEPLFDAGRICVPPHRRRMGYVFQDARLFPHLTVRRNLTYGARLAPRDEPGQGFDDTVDLLGIAPLLDRRPAGLSGGERQRVAIGRALLSRPRLLLADEPLAALDTPRKQEILPLLERLRDSGVPILYVTHAVGEVARLATHVVVLEHGRAVRQGAATDVLSDPEVTPVGVRAVGALVEGRVAAQHRDGLVEVAARGYRLLVPGQGWQTGAPIRVQIAAKDVMLATEAPKGISALNVLPARVIALRQGRGPGVLVQLAVGQDRLLARVTQRSAQALALTPGQSLYAVIKAVSVPR